MKVVYTIIVLLGLTGFVGLILGTSNEEEVASTTTNTETTTEESTTSKSSAKAAAASDQYISPEPLPDYLELGGEPVPLDDYEVRERLDRELLVNTYWHSSTVLLMRRAYRYFPVIEPILAEHGVPDDFKYLALIESGLDMTAQSGAGAKGPWQFLKAAAQQYGLEVANEVDERYHIEKATHAAAKYLKNEHRSLGSWAMAAAAYNAGHGRIRGTKSKQLVDNYYDMYLTTETARYVFRILAIKLIYENPQKYGFHLNEADMYKPIPAREVEVTSIDNIPNFAKNNGVTYKALKLLNPWLRSTKLSKRGSGKKYIVKIPT